jgi:hypothetical protein
MKVKSALDDYTGITAANLQIVSHFIAVIIPLSKSRSIFLNLPFIHQKEHIHGFGGLEVACWPLVPKFAGSNLAEAVGFFKGNKNPQDTLLRRGSKVIGPMS